MAIPFEELNVQNHQIAELSKVMARLIEDREMCDTTIVCELFDRYTAKVENHMEFNNTHIYSMLLSHPDRATKATANKFLEGEKEIKRLFRAYVKRWCSKGLQVYRHDQFVNETREMFDLMWERFQAESEQLYPLARSVESEIAAKVA